MSERLFLYIDILGFKNLIESRFNINEVYRRIDRLNVHRDRDFTCIVFSDTILVYGDEIWLNHPNSAIMWLVEFAQDLFYNLISLDVHIRAYVTKGDFEHHQLEHIEAYYGQALVECYEREKEIKCTGVFLDAKLAQHCDIFQLTEYDNQSHFVHVMQHLDDVSRAYKDYPIDGKYLVSTSMEWWVAYLLRYLANIHRHAHDQSLDETVRIKFKSAWEMISARHDGLCRRLVEADFEFSRVITIDWTEMLSRIGTRDGAFN
ncbi:MAG: hypothetical protein ACPGOV_02095 [Magnetovibrionaceae bacterium]